ncbi:hypothetical protein [Marinomonas mediterranea]|jgi:hypothetical protein|uniref:Uncharacterized protein n=1 Tax=Marinomonas mediterranea (strain ATCC 700492 / JCM 21426 / NBRC 103028 / MMB-1) TaxID=717774 RepID=F2JTY2_MARM1|nr:hypothetical protein [Marinomonas mediterranea]ADZ90403.1 hypothetical protein Marme_1128 [Marinomonas mediterranea MMB-1]WCN08458.1 hypothetical protein GV055_05735 [Marinomonas mediterranea]WCN12512.1 hypothetical protein GV054_05575 [Marinomonas mediterranea]WCN16584.1 hypothetical protein GV053_05705 [Marinomonas mediterranea MMB-1]
MQVSGQFPVSFKAGATPSRSTLPSTSNGDGSSSQKLPVNVSSVVDFENAFKAQFESRSGFSKVESPDKFAREALQAYESTAALAADNPRNMLIGVDVFA